MTLVSKAGARGDFSQAGFPGPNKLDRPVQSEMHDVAVRRQADGSVNTSVRWNGLHPARLASEATSIGSSRCVTM